MALDMDVGLGPGHIVLYGDPASPPPKKGGTAPHFSARVYCGKTVGWIKMPLGTKVGLGPGNTVRCGPSSTPQGAQPPIFGTSIVAKQSPISATAEHLLGLCL